MIYRWMLPVLALGIAGCRSMCAPEHVARAPDLEIQPMPVASAKPAPPPPGVAKAAEGGRCGAVVTGKPAPPLEGVASGRVTLVYFFATWCHPCQFELPKLDALRTRYASKGFDVLAVSVDDERTGVAEYVAKFGGHVPFAFDEEHRASSCWKVGTMPTAFLVDRAGIVRGIFEGYHDGDELSIARQIEPLL